MVVVVGSAGGVGAATVAVVSNPGPGLPGEVVGVTSLTDTLIGPKSFLDGSFKEIDSFDHCYHPSRPLLINHPLSNQMFLDTTELRLPSLSRSNFVEMSDIYIYISILI